LNTQSTAELLDDPLREYLHDVSNEIQRMSMQGTNLRLMSNSDHWHRQHTLAKDKRVLLDIKRMKVIYSLV